MSSDAIFFLVSHLVLAAFAVRHAWTSSNPILAKVFWTVFSLAVPIMGPFFCLGLAGMPRPQRPSLRVRRGLQIWSSINPSDVRFRDELATARSGADQALRDRLIDEFDAFPLGRHLLQYLEDRYVDIVVTNSFPGGRNHPSGSGAVGLFRMGEEPVVLLDGRRPYAAVVHTFAHETRHLAQCSAVIGDERDDAAHFIPEFLSPRHMLLHTRLAEMDAEAFATHFVVQHGLQHGMTLPKEMVSLKMHPKSDMYAAYLDALEANRGNPGIAVVQAAKATFDPKIRSSYDFDVLGSFENDIMPRMQRTLESPAHDPDRMNIAKEAKLYLDGLAPERDFIMHNARLYSALFGEAGFPDYISCWNETDFVDFIKKNPSGAAEIPYLMDIQHRFEKICAAYVTGQPLEPTGEPANKVPEKA